MPEGDSIFRAARVLDRVLKGRIVEKFESVLPALMRVNYDTPLAGRTIESVTARGKHLLMAFSGDLFLRTHMRMNGSWHIYRPDARWQRPARDMRILVAAENVVAVGFNIPVAEFLSSREIVRHRELGALGPDLLGRSFDEIEARRRIVALPHDTIADVLLNQRVVAGVGNVLKSEILFVAATCPFERVADLTDADIGRILGVARELMAMSVRGRRRQTTRSMDPRAMLWVYGRGGLPCRRCGATIEFRKSGTDARVTYWCPRCQPRRRDRAGRAG
jgi:endonuclease VIII